MTMRKGLFGLGLAMLAAPTWVRADTEIGKPAPAFALKDTSGTEHTLASMKGKIVVIEWMNHECPVCQRHCKAKTAANVMKKFEGKPVVWLGIDSTHTCEKNKEAIAKFNKDNGITFPVLFDADGKIGKAYGAKTTPHVFVIDQKGNLAYMGAIDDNPDGTNKSPKNYVEEAVNALLTGSTVAMTTSKPYGCSVKYKPAMGG